MAEKVLQPIMKWSQNKNQLMLTIDARDIKEEVINITKDKVSIQFMESNKAYKAEMTMKAELDEEKSSWKKNPHSTVLTLVKKAEGFWKGLTENDKKIPTLSFDWDHFEDSEEEEPEPVNPMANLGNMAGMPGMEGLGAMGGMPGMPNMPGMPGMGGMPGMEAMGHDEDSDDEAPAKLDDLEGQDKK